MWKIRRRYNRKIQNKHATSAKSERIAVEVGPLQKNLGLLIQINEILRRFYQAGTVDSGTHATFYNSPPSRRKSSKSDNLHCRCCLGPMGISFFVLKTWRVSTIGLYFGPITGRPAHPRGVLSRSLLRTSREIVDFRRNVCGEVGQGIRRNCLY